MRLDGAPAAVKRDDQLYSNFFWKSLEEKRIPHRARVTARRGARMKWFARIKAVEGRTAANIAIDGLLSVDKIKGIAKVCSRYVTLFQINHR